MNQRGLISDLFNILKYVRGCQAHGYAPFNCDTILMDF